MPLFEQFKSPASCAISRTQRYWTRKLKHIELNDLQPVCTFSSGGTSQVSLVQLNGHPDSAFALKKIQIPSKEFPDERQFILSEPEILSRVECDFVIKLYRKFEDERCSYLLTEYCPGGELLDRLPLSEDAARFYIACVVEAIDCLHTQNICYNDLKPENLVLDVDGYVKLIDFGLAEILEPGQKSQHSCRGTVEYLPAEIIRVQLGTLTNNGKDKAVDLWGLGILIYELLRNETPFAGSDENSTFLNIARGIEYVQFPRKYFSREAEDIIRQLCAYEPDKRLGYGRIEKIRQHRWFDGFDWIKLRNRGMAPPEKLKFNSVTDTDNFRFDINYGSDAKENESDD